MTSQGQSNTKTSPNQVELRVPAEIWHEIFLLATMPDVSHNELNRFWASSYRPFNSESSGRPFGLNMEVDDPRLSLIKRTILLVCKRWHAFALRCVYQVIYVGKHSSGLIAGLKRSEEGSKGFGYGRLVRRIFLSTWHKDAVSKHTFARVEYCPNASALQKACCDLTPIPATIPRLLSIKRFDWWWCYGLRRSDPTDFYFTRDIVKQAQNLEYLSIGPYNGSHILPLPNVIPDHAVETSISTLRLQSARFPTILEELSRWSFPNLTNLIVIDPRFITRTPTSYLNHNIKIIELAEGSVGFQLLFAQCPNVQELYFYLDFQGPAAPPFITTSIRRVGVRPSKALIRDQLYKAGVHITLAFDTFCGNSFPALRTIVLYGDDWSPIVNGEGFHPVLERVARSGRVLEFEDGSPISFDP